MTDITLGITLKGDSSGLVGEIRISEDEMRKLGDEAANTERRVASLGERMARSLAAGGRRLRSVGRGLTAGVTLPIIGIGVASLSAASDAEEAAAKFDTVFGDQADTVRDWADETAANLNRSTFAIQEYAAGLQDTFVPLGVAREQAAELSQQVTELAIDLASFNNVAEPEVVAALTSALVGNHEAVRRFGVVINQAALDQALLNRGVEGGARAATEQEKALARLDIILASTTDAQGDAARTSESFANQMRGLQAATRELMVAVGQDLLPAATELIGVITEAVRWFGELDPAVQETALIIAAAFAVGGPVLVALGAAAAAIAAIGVPAAAVIAAIGALGAAWVIFGEDIARVTDEVVAEINDLFARWRRFETEVIQIVQDTVQGIEDWLVGRFTAIVDSVEEKIDQVTGFFRGMWEDVVGNSFVPDMINAVEEHFARLESVMVEPAAEATSTTERMFDDLQRGSRFALTSMAEDLRNGELSWQSFGNTVASVVNDLLNRLIGAGFDAALGAIFGPSATSSVPAPANFSAQVGLFGRAHQGAVIGETRLSMAAADPAVFAGARRMHRGGLAGDEVPTILRRGEGVFTPEQMRALSPAGGEMTLRIVDGQGREVPTRRRNGSRGPEIEVSLDALTAGFIGTPGSQTRQALELLGARQTLTTGL